MGDIRVKNAMKFILAALFIMTLQSCDIYAVVEDKALIIESLDTTRSPKVYRVRYNDGAFFMLIKSDSLYSVGDTLYFKQ